MTFFFTLVFMVMVFWRPQEWLLPWLFGLPLLDGVVFLAILSLMLETDAGRIRFPARMPQVFLLGGLFLAVIMSHVRHTYFQGIVQSVPPTFKICFFTLLLLCVVDRPRRLRVVTSVFVVMSCIMAVHALIQDRNIFGFARQMWLYVPAYGDRLAHHRTRFFGIFEDPNDLAQILATGIPLAFCMFRRKSAATLAVGWGASYMLFRALLTTNSRGGFVALGATICVMIVLWFPARWMPFLLTAALVAALGLTLKSGAFLDPSAHDRVVFWGLANEQFKTSPVFGIGYGMFWQVAGDRAAHNAFVLCYTTLGFFGYWFWFNLLASGIVGSWRTRVAFADSRDPEQRWLSKFAGFAIAATVGFAASAYFLSRSFVFPMFFLFALLAGIPRVGQSLLPDDTDIRLLSFKRDVLMIGTIGAVGSILYIYLSILFLNRVYY